MEIDGITLLDHSRDMVAKSIMNGEWEDYSRRLWKGLLEHLPPKAVVWDVGAYTGYYALIAAKLRPDASIVAFEPHPEIFKSLLNNIKYNNATNVSCSNVALNDANDEIYLNITNTISLPSGSSICDIGKPIMSTIKITTKIADDIVETSERPPSLIKIDVEGAELKVVSGMLNLLKEHKPQILIEILSDDIERQIKDILLPIGYTIDRINEKGGSFEPPFRELIDRNYLCLPI